MVFHYRDWKTKAGSQEAPGVTGKSGLGVQNEAGQRLIESDILECEVKWALGSITMNKLVEVMEFQLRYFTS